ncbi:MAG: NAD(+)/NADH kinase [Eubacteriales bacterium]
MEIGLHVNTIKDENLVFTKKIVSMLLNQNEKVKLSKELLPHFPGFEKLDFDNIDVLLIGGGDGTILRNAKKCAKHNVKILGVNLGTLGFLSEISATGVSEAVKHLKEGSYFVEERMMLEVKAFSKDGNLLGTDTALNDVVISKKNISRTINITYHVNNTLADHFRGDGLIVSTPTGSTGYSLSAGGTVISPSIKCIMATPICAHSLSSKRLIAEVNDKIKVNFRASDGETVIAVDGRESYILGNDDYVEIGKSELTAEFIRFNKGYFYSVLREKFASWKD